MATSTITLTPAYGRDYKSRAEVRKDWYANKDFIIEDAQYPEDFGKVTNKEDVAALGLTPRIRYWRRRRVVILTGSS